jgi:hypothetical protein
MVVGFYSFFCCYALIKKGDNDMMMNSSCCNMTNQQCGCGCMQPQSYGMKAGCTTQYHQNCEMQDKLLWLADEAWEELMREKIRDHIEASCGTMMDELAKMAAETNMTKWKHKMATKHLHHDFKHGLRDLMNKEGSCKQSS